MESLLRGYVGLLFAFLYLPLAVIGLFSLNASPYMAFPLAGFSTQWYAQALGDARLLTGLGTTFLVAIPVTAITTVLGGMAALALTRHRFPLKPLFLVALVVPFFIPRIILAVSYITMLGDIGVSKNLTTVILAQSLIILPFTTMVIASVLARLDPKLEEAAADLGAGSWKTFRLVLLPLMRNGLLASSFVAFVLSSSEYTVSFFTSGRSQPLSILVASDFRFNLSPSLDALAMLIVLFNVAIVVIGEVIRRRSRRFAS
jgi:spermidine/putrescine transport system permease protein